MTLLKPNERRFAEAVSAFSFLNPFWRDRYVHRLRESLELGKTLALEGTREFAGDLYHAHPEMAEVIEYAARLLSALVVRKNWHKASETEFQLYHDLVSLVSYYRFRERFQATILRTENFPNESIAIEYYEDFKKQWHRYWDVQNGVHPSPYECHHAFACLFLIRRAFHHIYEYIWGDSPAIQSLRAHIWQSIFTHDFRRFGLLLYDRMEDVTTLVSGPSGSGKELVARAIGMSRYIAFDPRLKKFTEEVGGAFHPVNISALSPTIVESELFGHAKGAFTGADNPHDGWFQLCKPGHSVFLDEISELSPSIQVKLLRVLQSREFQRLGETKLRKFSGKLIVASNRDFGEEIDQGRFREDLYYRICSDVITTPSLKDQLQTDPTQLKSFAERIAAKHLGTVEAAAIVADDTFSWVESNLGLDYEWPGNFRELEQCVWNVLIRKEYFPLRKTPPSSHNDLLEMIRLGQATAEEVTVYYCRRVYEKTKNYAATARVVKLDQRTVKSYVTKSKRFED